MRTRAFIVDRGGSWAAIFVCRFTAEKPLTRGCVTHRTFPRIDRKFPSRRFIFERHAVHGFRLYCILTIIGNCVLDTPRNAAEILRYTAAEDNPHIFWYIHEITRDIILHRGCCNILMLVTSFDVKYIIPCRSYISNRYYSFATCDHLVKFTLMMPVKYEYMNTAINISIDVKEFFKVLKNGLSKSPIYVTS